MSAHEQHEKPGDQASPSEPAGSHGMAIIGTETVFLSHLPMFMAVHDYQVILDASFDGTDSPAQEAYAKDRRDHPDQKLYTLQPQPFVLPEILPDGDTAPRLGSIRGDVYRGHFERFPSEEAKQDALVLQDVDVRLHGVVHGRQFTADPQPLERLHYIVFGKGQEVFLAHLITRAPDFDQLIQVAINIDGDIGDEGLAQGNLLTVAGRPNKSEERLRGSEGTVSAAIHIAGRDIPVEVAPGVEHYLEERELAEAM